MANISVKKQGFEPVFDERSRVLILGSFPSVKSREISFYYGNKQNRFWGMLCGYFGESVPVSVEGKKSFLLRRGVALWDMATACEVDGSSDASVKNVELADLRRIFSVAPLERVLLNGALAYTLFLKENAALAVPYVKMPSTSPANPRYDERVWREALNAVFRIY